MFDLLENYFICVEDIHNLIWSEFVAVNLIFDY
jgi:hypothetical protein